MNTYPETPEQRRAGMAAFRARALAAHRRALVDMLATGRLATGHKAKARDIDYQRTMIATIEAAQRRFNEA